MLSLSRFALPGTLACVFLAGALLVSGCDTVETATDAPTANAECTLGMSDADAFAELDALNAEVDALETAGSLNRGQANALRVKLRNIRRKIERGQYCPALAQLGGFRDQVEDFVDGGVLTDEEADPLIDGADAVIDGPPPPPPVFDIATVSVGSSHTCALTIEGKAYCWGENGSGQLGDGAQFFDRSIPVAVAGDHTFSATSAGDLHTCGIEAGTGAALCWGNDGSGALGNGPAPESLTPTPVGGDQRFVALDAGSSKTCGITADGLAYCWGDNFGGAVGDGTTEDRDVPTAVSGGYAFASISVGSAHACGITTSGVTYCWGSNIRGELGIGTFDTSVLTPIAVGGEHAFVSVDAGHNFTCAIDTGGDAYCWGDNLAGQVGNPTAGLTYLPVAVSGDYTFASISAGQDLACGVLTNGAGVCWGENNSGQLGDGTTTSSPEPVLVSGGHSFTAVSAGFEFYDEAVGQDFEAHTCGLRTDGAVLCWGSNERGRLGNGTSESSLVPTPISDPEIP